MTTDVVEAALTEALTEAVRTAFEESLKSICGNSVKASLASSRPSAKDGVSGRISYSGDIDLATVLYLPKPTAEALAKTFVGCPIEYDSDTMVEVVGELANVVAGEVVDRLQKAQVQVAMSLPEASRSMSVALGANPETVIQVKSPDGELWVAAALTTA